ncbi:MAG TPA: hypothetical protein VGZ47_09970, partial [Gemmataceae bacterium]|nr:hypothetical protein [Gemmataceae bacterium]
MWKRIIAAIAIFLILVGGGVGYCVYWWYWPSVPSASPDQVASVEVLLIEDGYKDKPNYQKGATITTTDPAQIRALLDVFSGAERASEHKCGDSGVITIRTKDGRVEKFGILPGHNEAYYEYRLG